MDVNEYQKSAMKTLNPMLDKKDVLINSVMVCVVNPAKRLIL